MKLKNLEEEIKKVFKADHRAVGDDELLVAYIWAQEIGKPGKTKELFNFLISVSSFESITRQKRLICQKMPAWKHAQEPTSLLRNKMKGQQNIFDTIGG